MKSINAGETEKYTCTGLDWLDVTQLDVTQRLVGMVGSSLVGQLDIRQLSMSSH